MSPLIKALGRGARPGWFGELKQRMRYGVVLKFLGVTAVMAAFFAVYFHLLRNPGGAVTLMPLTALDRLVPFQPGALAAYVSLWVYVGIPPGLMGSLRDAARYGLWAAALCALGLLCFYLWPTAVPPEWRPPDSAGHAGFALLQGVDAAGNACPSLHVASAVFTAFWLRRLLGEIGAPLVVHAANWLWLALIVHSTVAIRQHVVLDAVGGVLLALPLAWASLRSWPPAAR